MGRQIKLYIDVNTWDVYDNEGNQLTSDAPYKMVYKEQVDLVIQYINKPPVKPIDENPVDKYTGFSGVSISSLGVIDNNWNLVAQGKLNSAITAGASVTSIEVKELDDEPRTQSGNLNITNSAGETQTFAFTNWTESGGIYTFTVSDTASYNFAIDDDITIPETPIVKTTNVDETDKDMGLFIVHLDGNSQVFFDVIEGNEKIEGSKFQHIIKDASGNVLMAIPIPFDLFSILDDSGIIPPASEGDYYDKTTVDAKVDAKLNKDFSSYASKASPVGADTIAINDSEDSGNPKEVLLSALATLLSSTPALHASTHEAGGSDELDLTGMTGELATAQTPKAHTTSHQKGGSDPIPLDKLDDPTDNTDLNATTSAHGLLPKLSGDVADVLRGNGTFGAYNLPDGSVTEPKLADDSVSTEKVQDEAIIPEKLVSTERMTKANIENVLTGLISSHYHADLETNFGINTSAETGNMDEDGNAVIFDYDELNIAEIQSQEENNYDRFLVHGNGGDGGTKITGGAHGTGTVGDEEADSVSGVEYDTAEKHLSGSISSLKFDGTGYALWETIVGSVSDDKYVINLEDNDFLIEFYANFNTLAASSKYALLHHYLLDSSSDLHSTFKVYYEVGRGLVFGYKTTGIVTEDWKEISASVTFSTATWYRIRIFRKSDRLYIYVDDTKYTDEVLTDTIHFDFGDFLRFIVLGAEVTAHTFGNTAPTTLTDNFDGWMQECIIKVGDAYYDTDNMDNTERQWYIDREYVRADAPPVFGGVYPTEITSSQTLPQDVFNHVVRVNVSNGTKIYLPYVSELNIGNRLVIQNVSTSNYFWLYEYDGASNSPYKLIPPKSNIELIYSDNGWLIISKPVLADNLTVNIDDTYNIRAVTNALPLHGIRSFWGVPTLTLQLADGDYYLSSQWNIANIDYSLVIQGNTSDSSPYDSVRIYSDVMINSRMIYIRNCNALTFTYLKIECTNTGSSGSILYLLNGIVNFYFVSIHDYSYYHYHINTVNTKAYLDYVYFEKGNIACYANSKSLMALSHTYKLTNAPNYGRFADGGKIIEQNTTQVPGSTADRYKRYGGQIILPNGQAWKSNSDIVALRTYLSTSQSIPNDTRTKIVFDSVDFDVNSDWDTANHKFVCQKRGIYELKLQCYLIYLRAGHKCMRYFYKNGSNYSDCVTYNKTSSNIDETLLATTTIFLEEGDYVEFYIWHDCGSTESLHANSLRTFATITLIHELDS